jgi:hypothetical protein
MVTRWASRCRLVQDPSLTPGHVREFPAYQRPRSTNESSSIHTSSIPVSREGAGLAYFSSTPNTRSKKSEAIQANNVEQIVVDRIEDGTTIPDQLSEPKPARDAVLR